MCGSYFSQAKQSFVGNFSEIERLTYFLTPDSNNSESGSEPALEGNKVAVIVPKEMPT